jgi:hypothetical protein
MGLSRVHERTHREGGTWPYRYSPVDVMVAPLAAERGVVKLQVPEKLIKYIHRTI